jgi:hypothetical protein
MSFFKDPFANISGGIHDLGKGISNATKNPLVDMAAAAALDYFTGGAAGILGEAGAMGSVTGLGAAGNAALLTGGIAGLSSGNLAQGLMAGLAGYGGASLGEGLAANAANTANTANELSAGYSGTGNPIASNAVETTKALGESGTLAPSSVAGDLSPNPAQGLRPSFAPAATDSAYSVASKPLTPMTGPLSGAVDVASKSPSLWTQFKGLDPLYQAGIGAAGIMGLKAMAKPQALNAPKGPNTQFIRNYNYNPFGGYTGQGVIPAAASGGIVALARGGRTEDGTRRFDIGGDIAAAYQAGDIGAVNDLIANNQLTESAVQNMFPTFDMSSVNPNVSFFNPSSAPDYTAPSGGGNSLQPFVPAIDNLVNASGNATTPVVSAGAPAAAAASTPSYNTFSTDQLNTFFSDPANAAVLNTPGGLAAAEKQFNADPTATMAYLQGTGAQKLGLSAADLNALGTNQGLQGLFSAGDQWIKDHPNATGAEIQSVLKDAGWSDKDVTNYFNRPNSAYGTNLATGKSFTGAQDINTILGQKQGFADLNKNITQWVKDHPTATLADAQNAMSQTGINELDVMRATGKTSAQLYAKAKEDTKTITNTGTTGGTTGTSNVTQTVLPTTPMTNAPAGTSYPYGNATNPGDIILNPDGSKTVVPNIPYRPYAGFSGVGEVKNAWTAGGGSTGYVLPTVKDMAEFTAKYDTQAGGSKAAFDYLMGKSPYPTTPYTPTGEISKPYNTSVMGMPANPAYTVSQPVIYDPATRSYKPNPNFDPHFSATRDYLQSGQIGISAKTAQMLGYKDLGNGIYGYPNPDGTFIGTDGKAYDANGKLIGASGTTTTDPNAGAAAAKGGLMGLAAGGMSNLGSYSDGGRLLRGPGDGISDSIPASIGNRQPARLADGEFVVPARIVSEIGNGSTEAGARKLYAMMDRVQNARKKTTGKNQVAANPRAEQYLPA